MTIAYRPDPDSRIVIATCTGTLTPEDAREASRTVWSRPEWRGRGILWDFRGAELGFRPDDVRAFAQFILENQPPEPPPRIAILTGRDVDFGMARMYEVHRQHPSTGLRVFRDYDEAIGWLLPPGDDPPPAKPAG